MRLTLNLPDDVARRLTETAELRGISFEELAAAELAARFSDRVEALKDRPRQRDLTGTTGTAGTEWADDLEAWLAHRRQAEVAARSAMEAGSTRPWI